MRLRPSVAGFAFDDAQFAALRSRIGSGALDPAANRLAEPPVPLVRPPLDLRAGIDPRVRERLRARGEAALVRGSVAALVLNGGMATRFGGGAKGVVPVVEGRDRTSFIAIKLAEAREQARALVTSIPVVLMHSFATLAASEAHLREIDWAGLAVADREQFAQSIMPRVLPDGTPLVELPGADALADTEVYAAPGHGDTLARVRTSGVLARLRARGVEHVLVSNVDNVGASVDPIVLGAHLEAVDSGAAVSVEVVRRIEGDAGGCVAELPDGPAIVEGFRLPAGVDLAAYPHFNTNTLWLRCEAIDRPIDLTWFAVRKQIAWSGAGAKAGKLEVVQFEQLIGQVTERVPSAFLEVERDERFLPVKTREELEAARPRLEAFAERVGLI